MLVNIHMLGRAYLSNPPRTVEQADDWLRRLVEKIEMKILIGPFSVDCQTLGNEGITGAVVIETSHATFHVWTEVERPFIMFDCYSCMPFSDEAVAEHLDEFGVQAINYMVVDRDTMVVVKTVDKSEL
jgi:S-adenosylmethionine/arginine decarboxylase-like enzyme